MMHLLTLIMLMVLSFIIGCNDNDQASKHIMDTGETIDNRPSIPEEPQDLPQKENAPAQPAPFKPVATLPELNAPPLGQDPFINAGAPEAPFAVPPQAVLPASEFDTFEDDDIEDDCDDNCVEAETTDFGSAFFFATTPDTWYTLDTLGFPDTTLLSINGNDGFAEGNIEITPTGITVNDPGDYAASFSVILENPAPTTTLNIQMFLVRNGAIDMLHPSSQLDSVATIPASFIFTMHDDGILENIVQGTTLSLLITNGGGSEPQPVTVLNWEISIFKING